MFRVNNRSGGGLNLVREVHTYNTLASAETWVDDQIGDSFLTMSWGRSLQNGQ